MIRRGIAILALLFSGPYPQAGASSAFSQCEQLLAEIAPDGTVLQGSKTALSNAIRRGETLRIGWALDWNSDGQVDIVHWVDSGFISLFGQDIFTQVQTIHQQRPSVETGEIFLGNELGTWVGLLGTNGVLQGRMSRADKPRTFRVQSWWCGQKPPACQTPRWRMIYQNDKTGRRLAGQKEDLYAALRRGQPIRIAWGVAVERGDAKLSVEHAVEPVFVTISSQKEVTAQTPEHVEHVSYADPSQNGFKRPSVLWRGMLSTSGAFDAVWVDRATGKEVHRLPQKARIAWFTYGFPKECSQPHPMDLAVPGGVIRNHDKK